MVQSSVPRPSGLRGVKKRESVKRKVNEVKTLLKTPLSNADLSRENRELKKQAKHLRNSNKILERENGKLQVTSEADNEGRAKAEAEVIRLKAALEKATRADRVVKFGREKCFS